MDPKLTRLYMDAGRLPNLARLARRGSFRTLETVDPPQSPVAWSAFITGQGSAVHGIFDFVHRDPDGPKPYLSTSRIREPKSLRVGDLSLPFGTPELELLREGPAFWQILESHGIPATVIKIPANFPPAPSKDSVSTSDMGTPDLMGSYGTFQLVTSDPKVLGRSMKGGLVRRAVRAQNGAYTASLAGPPDPLSRSGAALTLPVEVRFDQRARAAVIRLGSTPVVLREGEWSEWVSIAFDPGSFSSDVPGIVRVYAKALSPELTLYLSPVNVDPLHPILPLSSPAEYVTHQARRVGRFFTQGLAEDTKALAAGALDEEEFVSQALSVLAEREELLKQALTEYRSGLLFFYISSLDLVSHMFWRALEPGAEPEARRYADVIPEMYERVDALIGRALDQVGDETKVIVMSDHGFTSYRYKVNVNTWLRDNGYLSVGGRASTSSGGLGHIDWQHTQAYALGLNQVFVNLLGRETAGIVPNEERAALLARLRRELESWRHPETGALVVSKTVEPERGTFAERAPDILIGFNEGYRSSDESALGQLSPKSIEINRDKWSGDHCMDPRHVPGVLVSSHPVSQKVTGLLDFFPAILGFFGIDAGQGGGKSFFEP
jgi:predicted AlkP superfamily phosphohydrolase/phosphomutase